MLSCTIAKYYRQQIYVFYVNTQACNGYFFAGWEFNCNFVEANGGRGQADGPCRMISPALMSASAAAHLRLKNRPTKLTHQ